MGSAPDTPDRTPARVVLASAARLLAAAGVASPRVDAELLAAHVLGVSRGRLVLLDGVDRTDRDKIDALVARRAAGTPLQHLTGVAAFRHLELAVGPGVFVPRPETELLVDAGRALLSRPDPLVVDLCAGSGALGLAVANELPTARVVLVEHDPAALRYLRRNAESRQAAGDPAVRLVDADVTADPLLPDLTGTVDLVLTNPPYVPTGTPLPPDVAGADPDRALYGGADGLAVIRPLVRAAARLLRPGGALVIEHDDTHGTAVPRLLVAAGYAEVADHRDLAGRDRYSTARRPPAGWKTAPS
ncbi:peptide chain release factor N(5)-glutamine methyltransferase [Actinocatenispora sera]|uniref:peptide chain release factor N(5)-glutamine methyltransferase n=1 Tax=Actinocatenispora sera TaxID=390989 RepID=UPI00068B159B|nr:peptide chain release factor N(5)-glutamine methyltransferase [Actinocatenispora sera]